MTDRFDEAKRALEGVSATDVWTEAARRAEDGAMVPLAAAAAARRPPRRAAWIAAAAATVLLAGTVAVLASGDEASVDAGSGSPSTTQAGEVELNTYQADGGCKVGISGEPLPDPSITAAGGGGTMLVGPLNDTQQYTLQLPGQGVRDLVGERVEDVQLQRGTALVWFQPVPSHSVQVRWFPPGDEVCDSFTVSVEGGTEDENRHAAVDLAERVVLGRELPGCCEEHPNVGTDLLDGTEWQLERSTVDGGPTEGGGLVFTFVDGTATWTDGCNTFSGGYAAAEGVLLVGSTTDITSTAVDCEPTPTSDAVNAVMSARRIDSQVDDRGFLILTAGDVELVLRPSVSDSSGAVDLQR